MVTWTIYFIAAISILATAIIAPAMGAIYGYFYDVDPLYVKLILTTPSLFVVLTSFLCPSLCMRFGKKPVLLVSLIIYSIAGCLSGITTNIYAMLLSRAGLGIGIGLLTPISQSLPADFFTGTRKVQVLARANSCVSLGNIIFIFISGLLASLSWRYSFFVYAVAIPVFICAYIYLPAENLRYKAEKVANTKLPLLAYIIPISISLLIMSTFILFTNLAILMQERGLGSASDAGNVLTLMNIVAFFTGYNILKIKSYVGDYAISVILLALSLSFGIVYFANSVLTIYIGCFFLGIIFGMAIPLAPIALSKIVDNTSIVRVMSYLTVGIFFGQFFSPFFAELLPKFSPYNDEFGTFFTVFAYALVFTCAYTLYVFFKKKAK